MEKKDQIELRSQDVKDILEKVPSWTIRWSSSLILSIVLLFIFLLWLIKYPDFILADAVIYSEPLPQKIISYQDARIQYLFVGDNKKIKKNTILAVFENDANYKDVIFLKKILNGTNFDSTNIQFPIDKIKFLFLGDIETDLAKFEKSYLKYKKLKNNQLSLNNTSIQNNTLKLLLKDYNNLKSAIKNWEIKNISKSTIDGTIYFHKSWSENMKISANEPLFTIVPDNVSSYVARINAPIVNSGKIKKNQKVRLSLNSFPESEYGVLIGRVDYISTIPNPEGFYIVNVNLSPSLETNYKKTIHFNYEITAKAEIITHDLRLIERFFNNFKK